MRAQTSQKDPTGLPPAADGLAAHCRRVSTLAAEIAARMSVSAQSSAILQQAALLHHTPDVLLNPSDQFRLLTDVLAADSPLLKVVEKSSNPTLPKYLTAILHEFHGHRGKTDGEIRLLGEILTLANLLDEQMEYRSFESVPVNAIWKGLEELRGILDPAVLDAGQQALTSAWRDVENLPWNLPVQALVARDVLRSLGNKRECDVACLAALASRDPVLAGSVIQAANSALLGRRVPARTIRDAIAFIGLDATRSLMMALAVRPLFASAKLLNAWRHSVWMGHYCEALARRLGIMDAEEALLLGLVHDIGTVAVQMRLGEASATYARLSEGGCPATYIESLLLGQDHGEIGASVLRTWEFPPHLIEAVEFHHRPADSTSIAAATLYLGEFWAETDEDLPSIRHFNQALAGTGCTVDMLRGIDDLSSSLSAVLKVA